MGKGSSGPESGPETGGRGVEGGIFAFGIELSVVDLFLVVRGVRIDREMRGDY